MAIHPLLQGIEVNVCVNNEPLPEYDDDNSWPGAERNARGFETKTITKYIESVEDQEFTFSYKVRHSYKLDSPCLSFNCFIDGVKGGGTFMDSRKSRPPWRATRRGLKKKGNGKSDGFILPFTFTKIETTLGQAALRTLEKDKKTISQAGQIVVEVFRTTNAVHIERQAKGVPMLGVDTKVHEKALKGEPKYHGAAFGDARSTNVSSHTWHTQKVDDAPILRFLFKYRSKKALKELIIIERTPEPEEVASPTGSSPAEPSAIDLERLDEDQRRKVETFVRNLTGESSSQAKKVKRERTDDGTDVQTKKKAKKDEEIECIDLTDE